MKRIVQAAIAAAFAALIVLALFYGRARKEAENKVDLAPRPSAATPFREETTLRNVTKAPIGYTVLPSPGVRGVSLSNIRRQITIEVKSTKLVTDLF